MTALHSLAAAMQHFLSIIYYYSYVLYFKTYNRRSGRGDWKMTGMGTRRQGLEFQGCCIHEQNQSADWNTPEDVLLQERTKPWYKPKPKHPVKVYVWAGISHHGCSNLCIFERQMNVPLLFPSYKERVWGLLLITPSGSARQSLDNQQFLTCKLIPYICSS